MSALQVTLFERMLYLPGTYQRRGPNATYFLGIEHRDDGNGVTAEMRSVTERPDEICRDYGFGFFNYNTSRESDPLRSLLNTQRPGYAAWPDKAYRQIVLSAQTHTDPATVDTSVLRFMDGIKLFYGTPNKSYYFMLGAFGAGLRDGDPLLNRLNHLELQTGHNLLSECGEAVLEDIDEIVKYNLTESDWLRIGLTRAHHGNSEELSENELQELKTVRLVMKGIDVPAIAAGFKEDIAFVRETFAGQMNPRYLEHLLVVDCVLDDLVELGRI